MVITGLVKLELSRFRKLKGHLSTVGAKKEEAENRADWTSSTPGTGIFSEFSHMQTVSISGVVESFDPCCQQAVPPKHEALSGGHTDGPAASVGLGTAAVILTVTSAAAILKMASSYRKLK
ncbi:hypothetical protein Q8A73_006487 [Channa argus]|nr:hypothetical protein Q8A73_006487 [Channa argus]